MLICLHLPVFTLVAPQNSDLESFQCKLTALNSSTLGKLRHILDHRCIVGGGEQIFLLALGVSQQKKGLELTYCTVVLWLLQVICSLHTIIAHCPVRPCTKAQECHGVFKCSSQSQKSKLKWPQVLFKKSQSQQFLVYLICSFLFPLACAEVSDIHLGWEDAPTLEETGEFQAGAAKRYTPQCGDRPRAEGRGERRDGGKGWRAKQD